MRSFVSGAREVRRNVVENVDELSPDRIYSGDDDDRNARSNQSIFDGRGCFFITNETLKDRHAHSLYMGCRLVRSLPWQRVKIGKVGTYSLMSLSFGGPNLDA